MKGIGKWLKYIAVALIGVNREIVGSVKLCFEWHSLWNVWHIRGYLIISTWLIPPMLASKWSHQFAMDAARLKCWSERAEETLTNAFGWKNIRNNDGLTVNNCAVVIAINCDFVSNWLLHVDPFDLPCLPYSSTAWMGVQSILMPSKFHCRTIVLLRVDTLDFRCFVKICMPNLSSIIVCILVTVLQC